MDNYALYGFSFVDSIDVQGDCFISETVKRIDPSEDKNRWLDRLIGERKTDVRIQRVKSGKKLEADKYPCTVLEHKDRVIWLRLENEKAVSLYVKSHHNTADIAPIDKQDFKSNPYSFIFIDCREGRNTIAVKKEADAWRNTDTVAKLLEASLNTLMEAQNYSFRIIIKPETLPREFMNYNSKLIRKEHRKVKKMVITFKTGTIDPEVEAMMKRSPFLNRLLKEVWSAPRGEVILHDPEGSKIVDQRKVDVKRLIELILSLGPHSGFGLSLLYDDGMEVVCGEEVRISYFMEASTLQMLFEESGSDLFGEYEINKWLDQAANHVKKLKDEKTVGTKRERKTPKHVQDSSPVFDF